VSTRRAHASTGYCSGLVPAAVSSTALRSRMSRDRHSWWLSNPMGENDADHGRTFNLNNLFSRYNFQGEIQAIAAGDNTVEALYEFTDPTSYRLHTFMGRLVKGKDPRTPCGSPLGSLPWVSMSWRSRRSRTSAR
jgi:hypothetical protein